MLSKASRDSSASFSTALASTRIARPSSNDDSECTSALILSILGAAASARAISSLWAFSAFAACTSALFSAFWISLTALSAPLTSSSSRSTSAVLPFFSNTPKTLPMVPIAVARRALAVTGRSLTPPNPPLNMSALLGRVLSSFLERGTTGMSVAATLSMSGSPFFESPSSSTLALAPAACRKSTTEPCRSLSPPLTRACVSELRASCSGVSPWLDGLFKSHFAATAALQTSRDPMVAAITKTVLPNLSVASGCSPRPKMSVTSSALFASAAWNRLSLIWSKLSCTGFGLGVGGGVGSRSPAM
mmetsp:Transcript_52135/g.129874  ORF Transcript_52135/g.129874 Transcript_52135/m.129874 type:complete len:303 (-) Transcript_52135:934-1842(-)